jgi:hypothetical protein
MTGPPPSGAVTGRFSAPQAAREHAPAHDRLERRQPFLDLAPLFELSVDILHPYGCKISDKGLNRCMILVEMNESGPVN